jgi:hypothetical protein
VDFQRDPPVPDHVEVVGRFSLTEDVVTRGEMHVGRAACKELDRTGAEPGEKWVTGQQFLHGRHFCPLAARPDIRQG